MEILNYQTEEDGSKTIATFDVRIPAIDLTLHRLKIIRKTKGGWFISIPSYKINEQFKPYFSLGEREAEFKTKLYDLLAPFVR